MGSSPKLPKNYGGWNDFKSTGCDPEEGSRKDQDIGNAWNRFPWYLTQNLPRLWPAGFGELCILPHAATEAEPGGGHFVARWSHHSHGANWAAALTQSPCHGRFVASYPDLCWRWSCPIGPARLLRPCVVHQPCVSTMSPACAPMAVSAQHRGGLRLLSPMYWLKQKINV